MRSSAFDPGRSTVAILVLKGGLLSPREVEEPQTAKFGGAFAIQQTIRPEDRGFRFMIRAKSRWSTLKS